MTDQGARSVPAWQVVLAVAAGGGTGAAARYGLSVAVPHEAPAFPWATFATNVVGCALMGALVVLLAHRVSARHPLARPFLGAGVLGGFTTFSTYTVEIQQLVLDGAYATAVLYAGATLVAALLAVQLGAVVAHRSTRGSRRPAAGTEERLG